MSSQPTCRLRRDLLTVAERSREAFRVLIVCTISARTLFSPIYNARGRLQTSKSWTFRLEIIPLVPSSAIENNLKYRRCLSRLLAVSNALDVIRRRLPAVKDYFHGFVRRRHDLKWLRGK